MLVNQQESERQISPKTRTKQRKEKEKATLQK